MRTILKATTVAALAILPQMAAADVKDIRQVVPNSQGNFAWVYTPYDAAFDPGNVCTSLTSKQFCYQTNGQNYTKWFSTAKNQFNEWQYALTLEFNDSAIDITENNLMSFEEKIANAELAFQNLYGATFSKVLLNKIKATAGASAQLRIANLSTDSLSGRIDAHYENVASFQYQTNANGDHRIKLKNADGSDYSGEWAQATNVADTLVALSKESFLDGFKQGFEDGWDDGYADGYKDGFKQGWADGTASSSDIAITSTN